MLRGSFLIILLLLAAIPMYAQDITGRWVTIDDRTGKERSVVEITVNNGVATGRIVEIFNASTTVRTCENCTDDRKGEPMLGLAIIRDMRRVGNEWTKGTLLDPAPGKIYEGKIWVENGDLKVRGYVGFFYRTQTWVRQKK